MKACLLGHARACLMVAENCNTDSNVHDNVHEKELKKLILFNQDATQIGIQQTIDRYRNNMMILKNDSSSNDSDGNKKEKSASASNTSQSPQQQINEGIQKLKNIINFNHNNNNKNNKNNDNKNGGDDDENDKDDKNEKDKDDKGKNKKKDIITQEKSTITDTNTNAGTNSIGYNNNNNNNNNSSNMDTDMNMNMNMKEEKEYLQKVQSITQEELDAEIGNLQQDIMTLDERDMELELSATGTTGTSSSLSSDDSVVTSTSTSTSTDTNTSNRNRNGNGMVNNSTIVTSTVVMNDMIEKEQGQIGQIKNGETTYDRLGFLEEQLAAKNTHGMYKIINETLSSSSSCANEKREKSMATSTSTSTSILTALSKAEMIEVDSNNDVDANVNANAAVATATTVIENTLSSAEEENTLQMNTNLNVDVPPTFDHHNDGDHRDNSSDNNVGTESSSLASISNADLLQSNDNENDYINEYDESSEQQETEQTENEEIQKQKEQQSAVDTNILLREERQKAMAQDLATAAYHAELQRKEKRKAKARMKREEAAVAASLSMPSSIPMSSMSPMPSNTVTNESITSEFNDENGIEGVTPVNEGGAGSNSGGSSSNSGGGSSINSSSSSLNTLQMIESERVKRQKEMAQDLAAAAFHAELQRKGNKKRGKKNEHYKNQIESDMARVRQYAAQKKVRTEVKRVSDIQSNTNLLSRFGKDKKRNKTAEEQISLRRIVKPSSSSLSASASSSSASVSTYSRTYPEKNNREITMWDIVSKDSESKRVSRFQPPSKQQSNNNKGLLTMKSKQFKTPKKTSSDNGNNINGENLVTVGGKVTARRSSSSLRKRSIIIAFTLVMVQRVCQFL